MKLNLSYRFPFPQYPAVRLVLLFIGGVITAWALDFSLFLFPIITILAVALLVIELRNTRKASLTNKWVSTLLFFVLVLSSGALRFYQASASQKTVTENIIGLSEWEKIELKGQVVSISKNSKGKTRLDVQVASTKIDNQLRSEGKYKTRILWDLPKTIELGAEIIMIGTIVPVSEPRNPLAFNYPEYLSRRGIYTQVKADSVLGYSETENSLSWLSVRKKALQIVDQIFTEETAPIAKALLLGYKNELEGETRTAFARAGLSHIMAVSGLHVGLVVAPFWMIIPLFWTKKWGSEIGLAALILLLFLYAGITGFSTSVIRASVMAVFLTYGKLFSKRSNSINLTAVAALLILIVDPKQLFEIGFQLSFSAVLIILLVMPVIQAKLPYPIRTKWYGTPVMVMIISVVVQVGLYPLQVYYFGEVSVISPIANALFVPFLGLIVPLSLAAILLSVLFPYLGVIINYPSELFLQLMSGFVNRISDFEWAWFAASLSSEFFFIFWVALVLTAASWRTPKLRWRMLAITLSFIVVLQGITLKQKLDPGKLNLIVFDVGQGDASLVQTPKGKNVLVDTGIWHPGGNSGEQVILPYLKAAGINKLDAVILSHPHADHIGGIISIMDEIEVDHIYNSGYAYDSKLYQSYQKRAKELNIPVTSVSAGDKLEIDNAVLMLVLGPEGSPKGSDPNQHSVVINMIYGESEFLFTGDAGEDQEERLIENYGSLLDTDFLKVGHHGSKTSSKSFFLEQVTPEIATVSLGRNNRFRHPHKEAVVRLSQTKADVYYTSREKALVFESDGKSIQRVTWE